MKPKISFRYTSEYTVFYKNKECVYPLTLTGFKKISDHDQYEQKEWLKFEKPPSIFICVSDCCKTILLDPFSFTCRGSKTLDHGFVPIPNVLKRDAFVQMV